MTIKELIERNNELRPGLNDENRKFYDDFLVYSRTISWLKDEQAVEELLLRTLQELLEAQKRGQTARHYFANDPKGLADSLLKKLPTRWNSFAKFLFYTFFGYLAIAFIPAISVPGKVVDLGAYMLAGLYLTAAGCFVIWWLGTAVYRFQQSTFPKWLKMILAFLTGIVLIFPAFAISLWMKTVLRLSFDGWVGIAAIVVMLMILLVYQKISTPNQIIDRPIYYYILFQALVGILSRLPFVEGIMATKSGKFVLAGLLVFGLIIFWIVSWRMLRQLKKEDES
ncbi:hypothetical protein LQZ24_01305 [Fructobacillus sp. M1-13]|uniref:Integral membrane protein n=1 Tax=Fructobacillus papyriferae TaxID=2713171 RepID=A0ABS5QNH7_9LACO|nr:hypothetical protein [Fructobacillus papyriferae]MBS9334674.1 hypothetical protein [Fructobacillus papyriferae]MCD2158664.1 hypothetical protein [Fructobacillus papyriferae]